MSRSSIRRYFLPSLPIFHLLVAGAVLGLAGCGGQKKDAGKEDPRAPREVPRVVAAEASGYMNDAMFAIQIKDFPRAEQSISKAVKLRDDIPDWWVTLGMVHRKQGNSGDARKAYRKALSIYERFYEKSKDPMFIDGQIYLHVLLNEEKEARTVLEKAVRNHPDNADLQAFAKANGIDLMIKDPSTKENRI